MSDKTIQLIERYHRLLKEQGEQEQEQAPDEEQGFDTAGAEEEMPQEEPIPEEVPMTSEGEERYIADIIDAALFEPASDDAQLLLNLQSMMKMKKYQNARDEVLPAVLNIIKPSTEGSDIRDSPRKE